MKIITVVILVVVIILVGIAGIWYFTKDRQLLDGDGMERDLNNSICGCIYSESGGIKDSELEIALSVSDGKTYLTYYELTGTGGKEISYKIEAPPEAIEKIKAITKKAEVFDWGELKSRDVTDDSATSITFIVGDNPNDRYIVTSDMELPPEGADIFTKIYDVLILYTQGDE